MNSHPKKENFKKLRAAVPWLIGSLAIVGGVALINEYQWRHRVDGADVSSFNYTDYYIAGARIFSEGNPYSAGGPNVMPKEEGEVRSGGGKFMCCIGIPARWREGMKVTVKWNVDKVLDGKHLGVWYTATTLVPPYGRSIYEFIIHYLPNDRIRIQVLDQPSNPPPMDDNDPYIVQGVPDPELNTTTPLKENI